MLDGALHSIEAGEGERALPIIETALAQQRATIRELRNLSFALEPVVLRDHGFGPALRALADQTAGSYGIEVDVDTDAAQATSGHREHRPLHDHPRARRPGGPARAARPASGSPSRCERGRARRLRRRRRRARAPAHADRDDRGARPPAPRHRRGARRRGGTEIRVTLPAAHRAALAEPDAVDVGLHASDTLGAALRGENGNRRPGHLVFAWSPDGCTLHERPGERAAGRRPSSRRTASPRRDEDRRLAAPRADPRACAYTDSGTSPRYAPSR